MNLFELFEADTLQPPSIDVGDTVLVGKFKNRKAKVTGFKKDDNNQPVLKTNKGDQKLFKPRIPKLMKESQEVPLGTNLTESSVLENPAFKAWFRKSKAVKNGKPMMFYHGTTKEFRAFDPQYSNTQHDMPPAFFFTTKPDVAQSYAGEDVDPIQWDSDKNWDAYQDLHRAGKTEQAFAFRDAHTKKNVPTWKTGAHVMPVYLRMEKPLRASGKGFHWNEVEFEGEILSTKDLLFIAKERGCDSIIVKNVHDRAHGKGKPSTIVAVFSPDQIKSAMTNTGAYGSSHNIDETFKAYHGSNNKIEGDFDEKLIGTGIDSSPFVGGVGMLGKGFYFTPSERKAADYGEHVIEAELTINNPLMIGKGAEFDSIHDAVNSIAGREVSPREFQDVIRKAGYDGIIKRDYWYPELDEIVVFDPKQIDNKGGFNPDDGRIFESMKAGGSAYQDFWEQTQEVASDMEREYRSGVPTQPWKLVPAAKLVAIWKQAAKDGFVRNERGLEEIAQRMIENTQRLCLNTAFAGHTEMSLEDAMEFYNIEVDDPEHFMEWAINLPNDGWRISDYGLKPLVDYAAKLLDNPDDKEKMAIIDLMLQVTHQRSNLASWFVEGGTATLDRLFQE